MIPAVAQTAPAADRTDVQPDPASASEAPGAVVAADDRSVEAPGEPQAEVPAIVRRRLGGRRARPNQYLYSWLATAVIAAIAAILRLVRLDQPKGKIFDETYYATEGWTLIRHGVEWNDKENAAAYVVHPPLGKWAIGLGEWVFGYDEFGWRISAVVAGVLSVIILTRVARLMFGSTVLGCAAGLLLSLDGMHFVLSRSALLDIFLMLFVLAAFGALVLDRDVRRRRWLRALENGLDPNLGGRAGRPPWSWSSSIPWWRLLAAVLLGCAIGVKWSGLFFVPVFAVLVVLWERGARRSAGVRTPWSDTFLDETGWLVLCGLLIVLTYLATWSGWFISDDGYFRHWLESRGQPEPPVLGALQNLWHYHAEAFQFHSTLTSNHTYRSWPWQWLLLGRPVAFYWSGAGSCGGLTCASEVLLLGTPVLWWSFAPALAALTWLGIARRDWRAGAIWLSVIAGLVPWFYYALHGRTMFYFYALPVEPFLILAVVYVLGALMSPPTRTVIDDGRMLAGAVIAGAFVLLVAACFAYFYPLYTGETMSYADWAKRMFLGRLWI